MQLLGGAARVAAVGEVDVERVDQVVAALFDEPDDARVYQATELGGAVRLGQQGQRLPGAELRP